jgi:hypothetical protein
MRPIRSSRSGARQRASSSTTARAPKKTPRHKLGAATPAAAPAAKRKSAAKPRAESMRPKQGAYASPPGALRAMIHQMGAIDAWW